MEGWIVLQQVDDSDGVSPATSRLVAQFFLPEATALSRSSTFKFDFYAGESPTRLDGNEFPFVSNPINAIQVLRIHSGSMDSYLIIGNWLFLMTLDLSRQNDPNFSFSCRFGWKD